MRRWLLILACLLAAPAASAQTPAAAWDAAAKDLARVRPADRPYARWLALPHVDDKEALARWEQALRFWVNSLSREADLVAPLRVAGNLWRIDLRDYRWDAKVWEKLADVEPWYLVKIVVADQVKVTKYIDHPGGDCYNPETGRTVKNLAKGRYSYEVLEAKGGKQVRKVAAGIQVPAAAYGTLAEATGSAVPLVRLDWWLNEVSTANDRGTGYYDFLGVGGKAEKDFQNLGGVDTKKARELQKEIGALVSRSTVTLNNRALDRFQGITGAYWKSRDFKLNTADKNALRLLDDDIKEDASEQYLALPNGLFAFWLQNGDGVRQDTAPDFIAADKKATGVDSRVHSGISCVRCHDAGGGGIQPINDWARKVYQPPFSLDDRLFEEQKRKRAKYLSDLKEQVEEDQARYARVLKRVNGLTPAKNAEVLAEAFSQYLERDRDLAAVALELGIDRDKFLAALKAEAKTTTLDPVLAALVQGLDARVEHVEELVPLCYEIVARHGGKP